MKELSIAEKAKAYDEALSVAQETYTTQPMYRDWLAKMFHELKESEDERIKKEILSFLREGKPYHCPDSVKRQEWASWIEKQGEYKSPEELLKTRQELYQSGYNDGYKHGCEDSKKQGEKKPKFRVGDTIKCKYDDEQFTIKSVDLDKGIYTYTQEGCGNDIDYADEEFELVE